MDELSLILEQSLYHALHVRNLSPLYISSVRSTCKSYFEHAKVHAVYECTQDNIEAWLLDGRAFRNWSAATFRSKHRDLGFLFRYLIKRGKIQADPTKGIELPKLGASLPRSISLEDAEKLLAYTRRARYAYKFEAARNYAMIALMLHTGLRKSEVIHLKMEDVDMEHLQMRVIQGKGKKDRIVPISTKLAAILQVYIQDRGRLQKECEFLFTTAQYDTPLTTKTVNRIVKRLRQGSGVTFSCHSLRHTFATLMLEGGCDLYTLSRMMGHSKITTTTIYLSCTTKMLMTSIEKHPLN